MVEVHVLHVYVDVDAQQPLVLYLSVLRHHQHVLLCDKMINDVADFLARLLRPFE